MNLRLKINDFRNPGGGGSLILAAVIPLVAFGLQWTFWSEIQPYAWFLFFPAVFFSSWFGGWRGGLLATCLSTVLVWYFFIPPQFSFAIPRPIVLISIGLFIAMGVIFSWFHERLRRANRLAAAAAVQSGDQRYRQLFEHINEGLAYCRMIFEEGRPVDFEYLEVNERFATLTGLQGVVGRRVSEVIPGLRESDSDLFEIYGRVAMTGRPEKFERFVQALQLWFSVSLFCPQPGHFVAIFDVITERKQAEAMLEHERKLLRTLIDLVPNLIFIKDRESRYLTVNQAMAGCYGRQPADMLGHTDAEFVPADQAAHFRGSELKVLAADSFCTFEDTITFPDGQTRTMVTNMVAFRDPQGKVAGLVGIGHDFTQRQRVTAMLEESARQLLAAQHIAKTGSYSYDFSSDRWSSSVVLNDLFGISPIHYTRNMAGWLQIVHPDDRADLDRYVQESVYKNHAPFDRTYRIVRQNDGQERWVHGLGKVALDGQGSVARLEGTIQDVTEQKLVADSLANERLLLRTLVDHLPVAIYLKDAAGRKTLSNPVDVRNLGHAFESEVLGRTDFDFFFPEQAAISYADDQQVMQTGRPLLDREEKHVHADGTTTWYLTSKVPLRDAAGRITGLAGVANDITERRQLEENHARLATAVEQSAESIVITDIKGAILYANPAFEKSSGYTLAEALGRNPRILKSGRHDAVFYRQMWETLVHGEIWSGHMINRRKDGTLYEEEATITPVRDAVGKVVNYVAVKRDVTRELQLEAQFRQSQKMEAIGQLASGVAHDFNNILAVILMQAGLLKTEPALSGRKQQEYADDIAKAAERAANLTRQLLLFSRKQSLQPRELDLNESVTGIAKMLQRVLGEQIQIQFKLATQPLLVHADPGMMDQVMMNLTVNARDAMAGGGQLVIETTAVVFDEFSLTQCTQSRPGEFACVSVTDTGSGIPPEILPRIFEPFFTTKEVGKGSGLGLATVFGIVQQHQGWINVYSEVGRGTTFRIYLPRNIRAADQVAEAAVPIPLAGGNETILLVEDDEALRASSEIALARLGYRVLTAPDGVTAVQVWQTRRAEIHLLLTDLMMPGGLSGKDLAAKLLAENPKLKVIFASGYSAEIGSQDFPLKEGVNFLTKPFEIPKLAQTVRRSLDIV